MLVLWFIIGSFIQLCMFFIGVACGKNDGKTAGRSIMLFFLLAAVQMLIYLLIGHGTLK